MRSQIPLLGAEAAALSWGIARGMENQQTAERLNRQRTGVAGAMSEDLD